MPKERGEKKTRMACSFVETKEQKVLNQVSPCWEKNKWEKIMKGKLIYFTQFQILISTYVFKVSGTL